MADFPTFALHGESPSLYANDGGEDPAIRSDMSGGYEITRPRFTRAPRRTFKYGFIGIPQSQYQTIVDFYKAHTTTTSFTWYNQILGETVQVRFTKPYVENYTGIGTNRIWNISFEVREV